MAEAVLWVTDCTSLQIAIEVAMELKRAHAGHGR
jgi:hypothetical protein